MSLSTLFAAATDGAMAQLTTKPTGSGVFSTSAATPFSSVVESAINSFDAPGLIGSVSPTFEPASSDTGRFVIELAVPGALDVWPSQLDAAGVDPDPSQTATQGKPEVTVTPDQAPGTPELPVAPNELGSKTETTAESLAGHSREPAPPHLTPEQAQGTRIDGLCGKSLKRRSACGNQSEPASEVKTAPVIEEGVSEKAEASHALEGNSESKKAGKAARPRMSSDMGRTLMGWLRAAAAARNAAKNSATPVINGTQVATAETIQATAPKCPGSALDLSLSQSLGRQNGISADHPSPIALPRRVSQLRSREAAPGSSTLNQWAGTTAKASIESPLLQPVANQILQEPLSSKVDEISFAEVLQPAATTQISAEIPIHNIEAVLSGTALANAIASMLPVISQIELSAPVAPGFSQSSSASAKVLNEPASIDKASSPVATEVFGSSQSEGRGSSAILATPTDSKNESGGMVINSESKPQIEASSSLASEISSEPEASTPSVQGAVEMAFRSSDISTQAPFPAQAGLETQFSQGSGSVQFESFEPAPVMRDNLASQVSITSEPSKTAPPMPPQFVVGTPVTHTDSVTASPSRVSADLGQTVVAPLIETPVSPLKIAAQDKDDTSTLPPTINPDLQRTDSVTASPSRVSADLGQTVVAPLIETPVSPLKIAAQAKDDTGALPPTINPNLQRADSVTANPSGVSADLGQTVVAPLIETPVSPLKIAAQDTDDASALPPTINPDLQRTDSVTASPSGVSAAIRQTVVAPLMETPVSPLKIVAQGTDDASALPPTINPDLQRTDSVTASPSGVS
ncbi:MAG: hypothetical protein EXS31_04935, partial [Pedosphaera sp.]|nr:hypothetical protein [Pedosphaera sp.]